MSEWQKTTLGELCEESGGNIQTGPFGSQLHAADYVPVGIPSIMPQNIGDNRISIDGIARIKEEDAQRLSRYLVKPGDIVYSRRGDVERRALIREAENGWLCGTGCLRVRFGNKKKIDPVFMSHYLGDPIIRAWIVQHAVGATMPNLNTSILSNVPVLLPAYSEQKSIAAVLGALDDKIELNRRMNETLESMTHALFKSWFVDFDPVQAKMEGRQPFGMDTATTALFPSSLVSSPLGDIPEAWTTGRLSDILNLSYGKSMTKEDRQSGPYPVYGSGGINGFHSEPLVSGPGIVVGRKGTVGSLYWEDRDFFPIDTVFYVIPLENFSLEYIYPQLERLGLSNMNTDAAVPGLNRENAYRLDVVKPPRTILDAYTAIAIRIRTKIRENIGELEKLVMMRDYLLPKLISGDIRIPDAEKFVEGL